MKFEIFYEYPLWFIPLCLLLGAAVAGILYFKNEIVDAPEKEHRRWKKVLAITRFILVSIIAWLLLSPFFKSTVTESEAPVILLLQDNTLSLQNSFSEEEKNQYLEALQQLKEKLQDNYEVILKGFDAKLTDKDSINFTGKLTNISGSLEEGIDLYKSRNLSAIILASDGIYNNGINPIYKPKLLNYPIYSIALGDTTPKKDLLVERVLYNKIVYLDDRFQISASIQNKKLESSTQVVLQRIDGNNIKELASKDINFSKSDAFIENNFTISADRPGVQHYRIVAKPVEGEFTTKNNSKDFFVNVLDNRQKILIAALSPHPDIAAIKTMAEQNKNYEVEVVLLSNNDNFNAEEYNTVVFHQIPGTGNKGMHWIDAAKKANMPVWYIAGTQTDFNKLNEIQNLAKINQSRNSWNEVSANTNEDFQFFSLSEKSRQMYRKLPPLKAPFGKYETAKTSRVLFSQNVGSVATDYPLWLFQNQSGRKSALTLGDGIWRWNLYNYLQNNNHDAFKELISKTLQYLSVKDDKRKFRIIQEKDIYADNEVIRLEAELYNDSYQLINDPDVEITIQNAEGKEYPFVFNRSGNAYELQVPGFGEGNYEYIARTQWAGKNHSYSGKFSIQPTQLEAFRTEADHRLLYQMSEESKGGFYTSAQLDMLAQNIAENSQIRPSTYEVEENQAVLNFKWIFFLLLFLLSFEWSIRKYLGSY
ncbi:MAG: hypothetical protein WD334_08115 [Chitinophagales bacterium]